MLAIVAAVLFGLGLIIDLAGVQLPRPLSLWTLLFAGLLCLALHSVGVGTGTRWRRSWWRGRR